MSNWFLVLAPDMDSDAIGALYQRQVTTPLPYKELIAEIAGDERTPSPDDILLALTSHAHEVVREHARLSLKRKRAHAP
jgi:hypothetical protein